MKRALLLALGLLASGCRTEIIPVVRKTPPPPRVFTAPSECEVHDFPNATDVPPGAKNLGWVEVKREATDEETYVALRKKICELGGDALSQLAWVTEPGNHDPTSIRANAWAMP